MSILPPDWAKGGFKQIEYGQAQPSQEPAPEPFNPKTTKLPMGQWPGAYKPDTDKTNMPVNAPPTQEWQDYRSQWEKDNPSTGGYSYDDAVRNGGGGVFWWPKNIQLDQQGPQNPPYQLQPWHGIVPSNQPQISLGDIMKRIFGGEEKAYLGNTPSPDLAQMFGTGNASGGSLRGFASAPSSLFGSLMGRFF